MGVGAERRGRRDVIHAIGVLKRPGRDGNAFSVSGQRENEIGTDRILTRGHRSLGGSGLEALGLDREDVFARRH